MSVEVKTRGIRGGEFSRIDAKKQVVVFIDNPETNISIKDRNLPEITVQNGAEVWCGTFEELFKKLKD